LLSMSFAPVERASIPPNFQDFGAVCDKTIQSTA
jgi:hypothetical protein